MGKFDNVAILTDIDKTFLGDGGKMVERNVEAIEYFKSRGGLCADGGHPQGQQDAQGGAHRGKHQKGSFLRHTGSPHR